MPGYVSARSYADAPQKIIDAPTNIICSLKYHPVLERYLPFHHNTTYRQPGNELRPNMRFNLTQTEYEGIDQIKKDWSYIAGTERRIDREIVRGLANKLWPAVEVEFSDEPPFIETSSYERLIGPNIIKETKNTVVWAELVDTIKGELYTLPSFDLFFQGFNMEETRKQWKEYIFDFMFLDYTQRFLKETALDPYKDILLFLRSVGAYHFVSPTKMIVYDYPSEIHSSTEFGVNPVLHNMEGPAIKYAKGGVYVAEGFLFQERFFTRPESITLKEIEEEKNQERRRIMTSLMGIGRYLHESGAEVVEMDSVRVMTVGKDDRRMPRALIRAKDGRMFLCGTDGSTSRVYYMPVPRDVTSCRMAHEAIAGPVGIRQAEVPGSRRIGWGQRINLGLDEDNCIAQS